MKREGATTVGVHALLLIIALAGAGDPTLAAANDTAPEIVEVYPNPLAENDLGEYVVVDLNGERNLSTWRFVDDSEQVAEPPPVSVTGTVAFSRHPARARNRTDHRVIEVRGTLQLANDGEGLTLEINGSPVDTVAYDRAPEGEVWHRARDPPWQPLGATDYEPIGFRGGVTGFVLPDTPVPSLSLLANASERLYLGGYTFGSESTVAALEEAHERGVDVRLHTDGRPVGGLSAHHATLFDRLTEAGIEPTVLFGDSARWEYHHAKYAVVDDSVLVTTENWKPTGTGGAGNRGWGVLVRDADLADRLAKVFRDERTAADAIPWTTAREEIEPQSAGTTDGTFPTHHAPTSIPAANASLVITPDYAEGQLRSLIANATDSIDILQVSISDLNFPLLAAAIDRARAGVPVRILLADVWYAREDNAALAEQLNALANEEDLPISVAHIDPRGRFEKLHAKGLIVDGETVVVSSINWNNNSLRNNREIGLLIENETVATYFERVFEADWPAGLGLRAPLGLLVLAALAVGALGLHAWRLPFVGPAAAREETYTEGPD